MAVGKRAKLPEKVKKIPQIQIKNMALPPYWAATSVRRKMALDPVSKTMAICKKETTTDINQVDVLCFFKNYFLHSKNFESLDKQAEK